MIIFDIEDIKTEDQANETADSLKCEAIKASEALRSKRKKIRTCESKIKQLQKWCVANRWTSPIKSLHSTFDMLEEARAEMDVSLWVI